MRKMKRREALGALASAAVGLCLGTVSVHSTPARRGTLKLSDELAGSRSNDVPVWRLLSPLAQGSRVGSATLVGVGSARGGSLDVDFEAADQQRFRVRICLRDDEQGAPNPIARTARYELFLANGGKGNTPTREEHGLTVMALASLMRKNETRVDMLAITTMRDRWRHMESRGV